MPDDRELVKELFGTGPVAAVALEFKQLYRDLKVAAGIGDVAEYERLEPLVSAKCDELCRLRDQETREAGKA